MTAGAEHFDAVVVGSGFGGSVMAYRLAEAGRSVCVLERGKAFPPGSFPRSPVGFGSNFWDPSEGLHGMFNLWHFSGLDAICASGLGGGSLIYANVLLRKDERWFVRESPDAGGWDGGYEYWPVTRADLDPHYDEVERMMAVQKYPLDQAPYDGTPKTLALRDAARALGHEWLLPNLAVTFANEGQPAVPGEPIREARANLHGRTRLTCRLTGECDVGCNYGAKNTLDYTYLTEAWHAGAQLRTRSEVRAFEPREGGGYAIHYVEHPAEREGSPTDTSALARRTITADRLVLSAGTLGTTYLLLRNRAAFPNLSPALGTRFSGNGDLLTFAVRCRRDGAARILDASNGPVITSAIRVPDAVDGGEGRGFYLEDAGFPSFVPWLLQWIEGPFDVLRHLPALREVAGWMRRPADSDIGGEVSALLGECGLSAGLLPLLGMGRDIPEGVMSIEDNALQVDWHKDAASRTYFDRLRSVSRDVAHELGGTFVDNPIWLQDRVVTVHALGGCSMGRDDREGVVDSYGRVYNYPGLYLADGAVMPGPVGPNPSLTIAALADRFASALLSEPEAVAIVPIPSPSRGADVADAPAADDRPQASGEPASVAFTEQMKGFITFGEDDYERGFKTGRKARTACMFELTIEMDDIEHFIADRMHPGTAEGYVECDALGGRLPVHGGLFNLFVDETPAGTSKRMLYRLYLEDGEGHPITLAGHKVVEDDPGFDVWSDTSTLYTRILAGHISPDEDEGGEIVASGILHIHLLDFAKQLTTFRVRPAHRVDAIGRFGVLFAGDLWEVYGPKAS